MSVTKGNTFLELVKPYDEVLDKIKGLALIVTKNTERVIDHSFLEHTEFKEEGLIVASDCGVSYRHVDYLRYTWITKLKVNAVINKLSDEEFVNDALDAIFNNKYLHTFYKPEKQATKEVLSALLQLKLYSYGFYTTCLNTSTGSVAKLNSEVIKHGLVVREVPNIHEKPKATYDELVGDLKSHIKNYDGNKYYETVKKYDDVYRRYAFKLYEGTTDAEFEDFKRNAMGLSPEDDHKLVHDVANVYHLDYDSDVVESTYNNFLKETEGYFGTTDLTETELKDLILKDKLNTTSDTDFLYDAAQYLYKETNLALLWGVIGSMSQVAPEDVDSLTVEVFRKDFSTILEKELLYHPVDVLNNSLLLKHNASNLPDSFNKVAKVKKELCNTLVNKLIEYTDKLMYANEEKRKGLKLDMVKVVEAKLELFTKVGFSVKEAESIISELENLDKASNLTNEAYVGVIFASVSTKLKDTLVEKGYSDYEFNTLTADVMHLAFDGNYTLQEAINQAVEKYESGRLNK